MLNSTNEKGRGGAIKHIGFYSGIIETVGYDPQCAILEIRLAEDGKVRRYGGGCLVPPQRELPSGYLLSQIYLRAL